MEIEQVVFIVIWCSVIAAVLWLAKLIFVDMVDDGAKYEALALASTRARAEKRNINKKVRSSEMDASRKEVERMRHTEKGKAAIREFAEARARARARRVEENRKKKGSTGSDSDSLERRRRRIAWNYRPPGESAESAESAESDESDEPDEPDESDESDESFARGAAGIAADAARGAGIALNTIGRWMMVDTIAEWMMNPDDPFSPPPGPPPGPPPSPAPHYEGYSHIDNGDPYKSRHYESETEESTEEELEDAEDSSTQPKRRRLDGGGGQSNSSLYDNTTHPIATGPGPFRSGYVHVPSVRSPRRKSRFYTPSTQPHVPLGNAALALWAASAVGGRAWAIRP